MAVPRRKHSPSGRFVLRIDPGMHALFRRASSEEGVSLNDYCVRKLAAPVGCPTVLSGLADAVQRAGSLLGEDLIGIAVFGSWARGEAVDGSDLDLLVVVEKERPLGRNLYRIWDEAPLTLGGRALEPQFVHLPDREEMVAGIWAEVALDGIVLFERALRLSRRLVRVRRDIVEGKIVRRSLHGQHYWIRNEVA